MKKSLCILFISSIATYAHAQTPQVIPEKYSKGGGAPGRITAKGLTMKTNDPQLMVSFEWAKNQALFYVHDGSDPVGKWYEAALPGREAFCMRDVSHQTGGANPLALQGHNKNMLYKFAVNISESKDWCSLGGDQQHSHFEINCHRQA